MWCGKMGLPDMSQEMEIFGRIERQECEVSRHKYEWIFQIFWDLRSKMIPKKFQMNCTGRLPRPDELIDDQFKIAEIRNYTRGGQSGTLNFTKSCSNKACAIHLDYEYNTDLNEWQSTQVRNHKPLIYTRVAHKYGYIIYAVSYMNNKS